MKSFKGGEEATREVEMIVCWAFSISFTLHLSVDNRCSTAPPRFMKSVRDLSVFLCIEHAILER